MKPVLLHAGADLREAIDDYEGQRAGLGGEFEAALEDGFPTDSPLRLMTRDLRSAWRLA